MNKGFTLIEMLVVIAIIGILAAIAFPVFSRAKDSAYRGADMSNLNSIGTALQLYRNDQGGYPPALLGYADTYDGTLTNVVPASKFAGTLFPKRIDSLHTLTPAYDRLASPVPFEQEVSTAVWPNKVGTGQSAQKYGPADGPVKRCVINPADATDRTVVDNYYYRISGYDTGEVPDPSSPQIKRNELRYTLFWTGYTVPTDPCNPGPGEQGSAADDPRQLGYFDPPETTVVTWDSWFREYDAGGATPSHIKRDIVLFLGGSARMMDSLQVFNNSWKVMP